MEIGGGEGQIPGKGPIMAVDPQNSAIPAVTGLALLAEVAGPASDIDFTHYPLAQPARVTRPGHHPHELVAQDATKLVVALKDLPIGATDASQRHPDEHLAGAGIGDGQLFYFWGVGKI
jgi:hypothetical protein